MSTNQEPDLNDPHLVEAFNEGCYCITLDREALFHELSRDLVNAGLSASLAESHPHLFAGVPLFVSRAHVAQLNRLVAAIDTVAQSPAWEQAVSAWAPLITTPDVPHKGVFFGYDFHLGPNGPQLIEINTNAGGALFNAYLARAQRACCPSVALALVNTVEPAQIEQAFHEMFLQEWHLQRGDRPLRNVAIVDHEPEKQGLYPEFVLFKRFFEKNGVTAHIVDPSALHLAEGRLKLGRTTIDLVYNRLCDFYLEQPEHRVLAEAYQSQAAVITPHPHAYARYGDKRNLTLLADETRLRQSGVDEETIAVLRAGVPETVLVTPDRADELWSRRKQLFFKPVTGFGSRAVYRGAKLTKKVWAYILEGGYVAQAEVAPAERQVKDEGAEHHLKSDLRAFVYAGKIQLLVARLYRGQTTNLRTPGGGFAPVFTEAVPLG